MKRNPGLDYGQWAVLVSVAACVVASWARLSSHQLWQDVVILISGVVIGLFGILLALNWHGFMFQAQAVKAGELANANNQSAEPVFCLK